MTDIFCVHGHQPAQTGPEDTACATCGEVLHIRCPTRHEELVTTRFCRVCGQPLFVTCRNGHQTPAAGRFCAQCGAGTVAEVPDTRTAIGWAETPAAVPMSPGSADPRLPTFMGAPPGTPVPVAPPRPAGGRGWWIIGGIVAVVLILTAAVAGIIALTSHPATKVVVAPTPTSKVHTHPDDTVAPTDSVPSTANSAPLALLSAQQIDSLLTQSANDRSQVTGATPLISSCSDPATAQQELSQAAASRQQLISQLEAIDVAPLPNGTQLVSLLSQAWQASAQSDQSYAMWAADMEGNCPPGGPADHTDTNFEAAQGTDATANADKAQFVAAWNPVAVQYNLPQRPAGQI